jgi:uncharacterized protein involved in propanediol utilization
MSTLATLNLSNDDNLCRHQYSIGSGRAHGTFGELLQGILLNQKRFMVTFPINLFSYVTFVPDVNTTKITSFPEDKIKSIAIAKKLINYFKSNLGGKIFINSDIPEGRGLASSSADLVATAYAVANCINVDISEELIAEFISEIEPSDGVMYPGIVSFYHQEVKLINFIGNLSSLVIVGIDEGYTVDTLEYNTRTKSYTAACAMKYQQLLDEMTIAIRNHDLAVIGKIATESSIMNQENNPKMFLEECLRISNEIGALGVVNAHSGSFIGILLNPASDNFDLQQAFCKEHLKKL